MIVAVWARRHRDVRASSCPGVYRVTEDDGKRPAIAECDECGDQIGVSRKALDGPQEATEPLREQPVAAGSAEALGW